jgi:hypothetical protein
MRVFRDSNCGKPYIRNEASASEKVEKYVGERKANTVMGRPNLTCVESKGKRCGQGGNLSSSRQQASQRKTLLVG